MSPPDALKYCAFLSYSHKDTTTAKRVHSLLERFQIGADLAGRRTSMGPIPKTLKVFRDRHDFEAGGALASQTIAAIDDSAALILLASPDAAKSAPVNEEVRQFKSRHPGRPVIPLICEHASGDVEAICFPRALRYEVTPDGSITDTPVQPLAADLRDSGDGRELAMAKVIARLIGLAPDEVYRRAERERRRRKRNWIVGLAFITVLLAGLTSWAEFNSWMATTQHSIAEIQRKQTLSVSNEKLGDFELTRGNRAGALEAYHASLDVMAPIRDKYPSNIELQRFAARTHEKIGLVLRDQGKLLEAMNAFHDSLAIRERLALEPTNSDLTDWISIVPNVLLTYGNLPEALEAFRNSLRVADSLVKIDPANANWQRDLSRSYEGAGAVLQAQGNLPEALQAYRKRHTIAERMATTIPSDTWWRWDLSVSFGALARVHSRTGQLHEARESLASGRAILARLVSEHSDDANWEQWKQELAWFDKQIEIGARER